MVDVYLDMESGFDGSVVTAGILNAATHGSGGVWTTSPSPLTAMTVRTAYEQPLGSPVIADGVTYTDAGSTRSFAFRNYATASGIQEIATYTFTTPTNKVSVGCFVRLGNFTGASYGSFDLIAMEGDNGEFAVLNFQDAPGADFVWQIHTQAGVGNSIRIVANKTYWTTMLWDKANGRATLKVYDPVTWSLIGTSTLALQNEQCVSVSFGQYGAHPTAAAANGVYHYYDDLMIDFSNASFPILPEKPGVVFAPITLSTVGAGTISGAINDALLEIDHSYTLTAKPAPGYLFAGWTGSASSPNATLHFVMASNLSFTATFVTNYFPYVKGTYNGLFYDPTNTRQQSSGYVTFTVNNRGSYSGRLLMNGKTYRLHGALAPDGTGSYTIPRPNTNALSAHFYLDLTNNTDSLDGYVAEETAIGDVVWSSELVLDRATYNRTNPAPNAGRYTVAILPDVNSPSGPVGESVGAVTLSAYGALSFVGNLADGTKATQRTTLSKDGIWPLYFSFPRGLGALLSPVTNDTSQLSTDLSGPLCWFKQSQPTARYYSDGFTNSTTLVGSRFTPPTPTNSLLNLTNAILAFTNIQLSTDFTNVIELTPQNTIINHSANKLSVTLSKTTGLFNGSVIPPDGGKAISFSGALLQKQNVGAGFFLITNESGSVILAP